MTDMLQQASQWLSARQASFCSTPVTYRRGTTDYSVNALFGKTDYELQDEYGVTVAAHVVDFLITAAAFPLAEPLPGDRIITSDTIYEVMNLAGQGHWRWTDPYHSTLRIHTRSIGTS